MDILLEWKSERIQAIIKVMKLDIRQDISKAEKMDISRAKRLVILTAIQRVKEKVKPRDLQTANKRNTMRFGTSSKVTATGIFTIMLLLVHTIVEVGAIKISTLNMR
jgi:hypothetical protein